MLQSGQHFHDATSLEIRLNDKDHSEAVGSPVTKIIFVISHPDYGELEHTITLFSDKPLEIKHG